MTDLTIGPSADKTKKKKGRSPSYPAIPLDQAIDRVRQIWDKEKQYATPVETIAKHWSYRTLNGPAALCLAALKKYGLLDDEGTGAQRTAKVTDLAVNILANPNEAKRQESIREAALKPTIHAELWEKYHNELPSDATLNWVLTREKDFTETGAKEFIREYQATIAFAHLFESGTIETQDASDDGGDGEDEVVAPDRTSKRRLRRGMMSTMETGTYFVPIAAGLNVAVEGPFPLTEDQWEQFQAVLSAMKPALVSDKPRESLDDLEESEED